MLFLILNICLIFNSYATVDQDGFTQSEIENLKENSFILKSYKIPDKVWPEVRVKAYLKSKPLESIAIFAAYDLQKTYIPKLLESTVIKQNPPNEVLVNYKMDLPWPLSDSHYIHGHKLSQMRDNAYQLNWFLVESDAANQVNGSARFEPYQDGTLMTYKASVEPKSFFAGALKKLMIKDVKKTIQAIVDEVEKYRKSPGSILPKYKQKILQMLEGKKAY